MLFNILAESQVLIGTKGFRKNGKSCTKEHHKIKLFVEIHITIDKGHLTSCQLNILNLPVHLA